MDGIFPCWAVRLCLVFTAGTINGKQTCCTEHQLKATDQKALRQLFLSASGISPIRKLPKACALLVSTPMVHGTVLDWWVRTLKPEAQTWMNLTCITLLFPPPHYCARLPLPHSPPFKNLPWHHLSNFLKASKIERRPHCQIFRYLYLAAHVNVTATPRITGKICLDSSCISHLGHPFVSKVPFLSYINYFSQTVTRKNKKYKKN